MINTKRFHWTYSFLYLVLAVNTQANSAYSQIAPRTIQAHSARVQSVAFSPIGSEFASAGRDGKIKIWDAKKLVVKRTLFLKGSQANSVAFSRDGQLIACGFAIPRPKQFDTGKVLVWETKTGKLLHTLIPKETGGGVWGIAISPDGKAIAGIGGRIVDVWDVKSGKRKMALTIGDNSTFNGVSFSPDGKIIVATGDVFSFPGTLRVWDAFSGSRLKPLEDESFSGWTYSLAFSPDGKRLVVNHGRELLYWDIVSRKLLRTTKGVFGEVISVAYSPDGKMVASASNEGKPDGKGQLQLWDARTGKLLKTLPDHPKGILSVAFSPDGKTIISGGDDNKVRIWKLKK